MKPGLSDRLARLKKAQKEAGNNTSRTVPGTAPGSAAVSGEKDFSTTQPAQLEQPLQPGESHQEAILPSLKGEWHSPAPDLWVKTRICPSPLVKFKSSSLLNADYPDQKEWLFYDTETTGLSGGAGNIAFLVGIGRPVGDEFHITQYFLKDYPGEPAMLSLLNKEIQKSSLFISYNGKSFDKPLLETRFLMNRIHCSMGDQLDLLYPVRSLFKNRMPNCRLGTVEQELLDIHRTDDIPGAEIPDIWFSFLQEGDHPDLNRVMEHNDMDIYSLALLLRDLEQFLINPDSFPLRDSCATGRFLLDRNDERGVRYLEEAVKRSDPAGEVFLSLYLKRRGEWSKAEDLWRSILEKRLSPFAAVEMAKYLEHRNRDYPAALSLIESLLRELPSYNPKHHEALVHRRKRLLNKIRRGIEAAAPENLE